MRKVLRGDRTEQPQQRPASIEDLYGGGVTGRLLKGQYSEDPKVRALLEKRHIDGGRLIDDQGWYRRNGHEWKIPYGVRIALKTRLVHAQVVNRTPWYATWRSPKTGKRYRRYFGSLALAIRFVAEKAQYVDPQASVVSRIGLDIPPKLRNKIPRPWKWCPGCMTARKFYRVRPEQFFYGDVKVWNDEKGYYETKNHRLALLMCRVCGWTNREYHYRRSNQPWHVVKLKQGARSTQGRRRRRRRR